MRKGDESSSTVVGSLRPLTTTLSKITTPRVLRPLTITPGGGLSQNHHTQHTPPPSSALTRCS